MEAKKPLIRNVDCVQFYVPDLEGGLAFYRDRLGHELIWRTERAAGLRLPESDTEIVLQTERKEQEVDLLVDSADRAAQFIQDSGGKIIMPPFDIQLDGARWLAIPGAISLWCYTKYGQRIAVKQREATSERGWPSEPD